MYVERLKFDEGEPSKKLKRGTRDKKSRLIIQVYRSLYKEDI